MIKIHCTGCGAFEELGLEEPTIGVVHFQDQLDPRPWTKNSVYSTHLCRDCVKKILNCYFSGLPVESKLEIPSFVEPIIEIEMEPQSLKAGDEEG